MPRASIIIPAYNHERYVGAAIESVLQQTFQDFEVIVIDDCSPDGTFAEIQRIQDPRVVSRLHERNLGSTTSVEEALEGACGEFVGILNSDDRYLPEKLEQQIAFLDENPDHAAVFSLAVLIDENNRPVTDTDHRYYKVFRKPNRSRQEWLNRFFYRGNCLCHPSILIRRACYERLGAYDRRFLQLPDLDMWVRICMTDAIHVIQHELVAFRVHADEKSESGDRADTRIRLAWEHAQILERYRDLRSIEELLGIFPEARKLVAGDDAELIPFYLARLALDHDRPAHTHFALTTLHAMLGDPALARKLDETHGFTFKDYTRLTGERDVFGIESGASARRSWRRRLVRGLKRLGRARTR